MLKTPFLTVFSLFVALALACPALAQPREDRDDRDGSAEFSLTEAQKAAWDKLWTEYQDRTYPIKSQLRDARLLYRLLADQTNLNLDEAKRVIAEMSKLRDQLRAETKKFQADIKASGLPEILGVHANPQAFGGGHGFKHGRRGGHGPGHGHGPRFPGRPFRDRDFDRDRDYDRDDDRDRDPNRD